MSDVKVQTPPEDPYDLSETSVVDRPRNPDGTFAPLTPAVPNGTPAPEAPAAPQSKHPAYLVGQAQEWGFEADEIEGMSTPVLAKAIQKQIRQQLHFRDQMLKERTLSNSEVHAPAPPATPPEDAPDWGVGEDGTPLQEKDFHPGVASAIKSTFNRSKADRDKIKALEEKLAKMEQRDQVRETNRADAIFDAAFSALGKDYESVVGVGGGREVSTADAAAFKRRVAILREAQVDPATEHPSQVKAKIKAAAEALFGFSAKKPGDRAPSVYEAPPANGTPPKPRISQEEWDAAALARPTARQVDDEPAGPKKALKNLAKKLGSAVSDEEELEGFLGD